MNKLQNKIDEMRAKLSEMEAELIESKEYVIEYEKGKTYGLWDTSYGTNATGNAKDYLEHGRYRLTKQAAELSLERNCKANRLEALVESLGGLIEFVYGVESYYVYSLNGNWEYRCHANTFHVEKVYMTEEIAQQVCEILNKGRYVL